MQEEVENRTLTLVVSGTKFTGRLFKAAISKYMAHRREKKLEILHGGGWCGVLPRKQPHETRASPTSRSTIHPSGTLNGSPASTVWTMR